MWEAFVTRNMWHSCVRVPVAEHLDRAPPAMRRLYRAVSKEIRGLGSGITVHANKTGVVFMVRVRFAGITFRKRWLNLGFWLKREMHSPRLKTEFIPPKDWIYSVRVERPEDLGGEVRRWLREAYRVGKQEHLLR